MVAVMIRMEAGLAERLKLKAGRGKVNRVVVKLIADWLKEDGSMDASTSGSIDPSDSKEVVASQPDVVASRPLVLAPVVRASELPVPGIPAGAVCGADVRGQMCGKPAKFSRGSRYFCEEH